MSNKFNLSPEERAKIEAELELPENQPAYSGVDPEYRWDEELMRQVIGVVISYPEHVRDIVRADNFTSDIHRRICELSYDHFDQFGTAPDIPLLRQNLLDDVADKGNKVKFRYQGELAYINTYCQPDGIEPLQAIVDKCTRFEKTFSTKSIINQQLDELRKCARGELPFSTMVEGFKSKLDKLNEPVEQDKDIQEFLAEDEPPEFLIDGYLQEGGLYLFAGEAKAGKSTMTGEVLASVSTGSDWFGMQCKQSPCILVDLENPAQYIRKNLKTVLSAEQWPKGKITVVENAEVVTASYLQRKLNNKGWEKALFVVDSARAAFDGLFQGVAGWENSASEVRRALQPLSKFCHDTGSTILLVHHTNKSGSTSGSTDWHAAVDFIWSYLACGSTRTLSVAGRLSQEVKPLVFGWADRRLVLEGTIGEILQEQKAEKATDDSAKVLAVVPMGADAAISGAEIVSKSPFGNGKTRKLLAALNESGQVAVRKFKEGKSQGLVYYREPLLCN